MGEMRFEMSFCVDAEQRSRRPIVLTKGKNLGPYSEYNYSTVLLESEVS